MMSNLLAHLPTPLFLIKNDMTPMSHPPYSPNLPQSNFLFSGMKKVLKGKCFFTNVEKVKQTQQKH